MPSPRVTELGLEVAQFAVAPRVTELGAEVAQFKVAARTTDLGLEAAVNFIQVHASDLGLEVAFAPTVSGTVSANLGGFTAALTGAVQNEIQGALDASLGGFSASLTGTRTVPVFSGALSASLGGFTAALTGESAVPAYAGEIVADLGGFTAALSGGIVNPVNGTIEATLGGFSASLTGVSVPINEGTITVSLGGFGAQVQANHGPPFCPQVDSSFQLRDRVKLRKRIRDAVSLVYALRHRLKLAITCAGVWVDIKNIPLGQRLHVKATCTFDDELADPATLFYEVKGPDGVVTTYTYGTDVEVTRGGTGEYYLALTPSVVGQYSVSADAAGTVTAVDEEIFTVRKRISQ